MFGGQKSIDCSEPTVIQFKFLGRSVIVRGLCLSESQKHSDRIKFQKNFWKTLPFKNEPD